MELRESQVRELSKAEELATEHRGLIIQEWHERFHPYMTRKQLESAVESGVPFTLRMADGKEYAVPHPDYIWLPPNASYVIVHEDDGHFTVLPLLTMTGLRSKPAEGSSKKKQTSG